MHLGCVIWISGIDLRGALVYCLSSDWSGGRAPQLACLGFCTCCPPVIYPGGPWHKCDGHFDGRQVKKQQPSGVTDARWRAGDICVTLRQHLVHPFEPMTSGVEETELISAVGLFPFFCLSMQSNFTFMLLSHKGWALLLWQLETAPNGHLHRWTHNTCMDQCPQKKVCLRLV